MIVVIGSSNTDLVVALERLPLVGETVSGGRFFQASGGKGANQAVAAARAGARVAFVGRVGADAYGAAAVSGLAREGIDVSAVRRDPEAPSGIALILVGGHGENLIAVAPGANHRLTTADVDAALPLIARARVVLISLEIPVATARHAVRLGRAASALVIVNPAPIPREPLGEETLREIDVLVPNEGEAGALSGAPRGDVAGAAARLEASGVRNVVVTRGADGADLFSASGRTKVDAFAAAAVDTVGAGDCFCGSLAVALAEGRSLDAASRFAAAAAAISVTRQGAQPSMPRRAEIDERLARG